MQHYFKLIKESALAYTKAVVVNIHYKDTMKVTSFKNFLLRGNIIDLAVGVIIGAAFNKITTSLVQDIVMPPINIILSQVSFSNWFFVLKKGRVGDHYNSLSEAAKDGAITVNIGNFITVMTNFIIIAFCVYLIILVMSKVKESLSDADDREVKSKTKACPFCRSCIDLMATKCPNCTADIPPANADSPPVNNRLAD